MMNTKQQLADLLRRMNAEDYNEIREAYYKAVEGLRTLANALETADSKTTNPAGPLMDEHMIAIEAIDAMNKSDLGRIV